MHGGCGAITGEPSVGHNVGDILIQLGQLNSPLLFLDVPVEELLLLGTLQGDLTSFEEHVMADVVACLEVHLLLHFLPDLVRHRILIVIVAIVNGRSLRSKAIIDRLLAHGHHLCRRSGHE